MPGSILGSPTIPATQDRPHHPPLDFGSPPRYNAHAITGMQGMVDIYDAL